MNVAKAGELMAERDTRPNAYRVKTVALAALVLEQKRKTMVATPPCTTAFANPSVTGVGAIRENTRI